MGLEPTTSGLEVQCAIQLRHASSCIQLPLSPYNSGDLTTNKREQTFSQIKRDRSLAVRTAPIQSVKGLLGGGVRAQHVKKTGVVEHTGAFLIWTALIR